MTAVWWWLAGWCVLSVATTAVYVALRRLGLIRIEVRR